MKTIFSTLGKTLVVCIGTGIVLGVWNACTTYAAGDVAKDAYNEGYEKGLEMGRNIPKHDEEESD